MTDIYRRAFSADIEVRSGGDGRVIRGIAVPYGVRTPIREFGLSYDEEFVLGSFARSIAERGDRIKYLYQHNDREPVGRAIDWREDAAGLYGEWRISKTRKGDELLELVRDGVIDSNSVGFIPVRDDIRSGGKHIVRAEAKLREVSAVTFPAYPGAVITGLRFDGDELERAVAIAHEIRSGAQVSGANMATLKHVLSLVAAADTAVDEAQPLLAKLLGVPNPDVEQDAQMKADDGDREEIVLVSVRAWDGPAAVARIPNDAPASVLRKVFAWCPGGDDVNKSDCKFPFHDVNADGTVGAVNLDACEAGIQALNGARGGTTIPDGDREAVYAKLAAPLKAAGKTPAPLRADGMSLELARRKARVLGLHR